MKIVARWITILVVVPLLADWFYLDPLYRIAGFLAPHLPAAEASAPAAEPGHGAFCSSESEPSVFLGRDIPELGSYQAFENWCEERGGETGWKV